MPKDGRTEREKQTERLKVNGWVNGKHHVRRDYEVAGRSCASETSGTCLSEMWSWTEMRGRRSLPTSSQDRPCWPAGPGPSSVMLTVQLPRAVHQLFTEASYFSAAFQTQAWDLYFISKINILKAVFFLTVQAQVVFNYLRKALLGWADLFTVSLV